MTVYLTSNNTAAAQVPPSVTVSQGATSATFNGMTSLQSTTTAALISASANGTQSASLTVNPLVVSAVSLNASSVTGGATVPGTLNLNTTVPNVAELVTMQLDGVGFSWPATVASVTSSVSVPVGSSSAPFTLTTYPVSSACQIYVVALFNGTKQSSNILTINPPAVSSLTLAPASLTGGSTSTGTVTINAAAPACGVDVSLASDTPAAAQTTAALVTVPENQTSAQFTITTSPVSQVTNPTISATTCNTVNATLTVLPPQLIGFSISPNCVNGGNTATGTLTLSSPAPAPNGAVVTLGSDNAAALPPTTATVPLEASRPHSLSLPQQSPADAPPISAPSIMLPYPRA